jgi:thiosulfate reductase cytochrome b subunit
MHWINAAVMMIMITSGWEIYDDDVIIHGLHFSGFFASVTGRPGA